MTRWKTADILTTKNARVSEATKDWTADQLRERLAQVLAAVEPIRYTLSSLVENPYNEGQVVTSGLWPEQFGEELGLEEPWGARLSQDGPKPHDWEYVHYEWSDPLPKGLEFREASFGKGEALHPNTPILSVWQYHTACSIFGGSFDRTDVEALEAACLLPSPSSNGGE